MGHKISEEGIKPNPSKIDAVKNFPTSKTVEHIKQILGLAGYFKKFINNFSKESKPLTTL